MDDYAHDCNLFQWARRKQKSTGPASTSWGVLLVAIHLAVSFGWYPVVVLTAAKARHALLKDRVRRWLDRVTATVLIGLGLKLAGEAR